MKRVLAAALSLAMVVVLVPELVAYACGRPGTALGFSVCMDPGANVLDDSEVSDFGARVLGTDKIIVDIPIRYEDFKYWDGNDHVYGIGQEEFLTEDVTNRLELHFTDDFTARIFRERHIYEYKDGYQARIQLIAERIGLATGEIYVTYEHADYDADGNYRKTESKRYPINGRVIDPTINKAITGLTDKPLSDLRVDLNGVPIIDFEDKNSGKTDRGILEDLGTIAPESILRFKLNTEFFIWEPLITDMDTTVRKSTLDNNRVGVQIKVARGHRLIESAEIENFNGVAFVTVRFADVLPYVDERDFDFRIYLTYRDKRHVPSETLIRGTLANEKMYVNADTEYAYLGDGTVVEADEYIKNIELDLGNGVSVFRNLSEGKKYFGIATDERTNADREIMSAYPGIRGVLTLRTVNISYTGDIVKIDPSATAEVIADGLPTPDVPVYYIYDADGKYLGTHKDMLPYRDKYFLASSRLELDISSTIEAAGAEEEDEESDLNDNWDNDNDNPSTGY